MKKPLIVAVALLTVSLLAMGTTRAQQGGIAAAKACLHGTSETTEQATRRREALTATRTINNIQANRPEARSGIYLRQTQLAVRRQHEGLDERSRQAHLSRPDLGHPARLAPHPRRDRQWLLVHDQGHDRPVRLQVHQQSGWRNFHGRNASIKLREPTPSAQRATISVLPDDRSVDRVEESGRTCSRSRGHC
jgi:hypothetical protein